MNERDWQLFEDVLEFAERALRILGSRSFDSFLGDEAVLYSVRYCVLVIGECANELSLDAQSACPGIPWRQAAATRHRLVHGYGTVTDRIIFDTVRDDLPPLLAAIVPIVAHSPHRGL